MNGNKAVLDSNVVIFFSKRKIDIDELSARYEKIFVSIITYIEVYAYEFVDGDEKALIDRFFANIEIDHEIANQAIVYRKSKIKKIKLPDAIILASAKIIDADLVTDNYKDFQNIDPSVNLLNLNDFKIGNSSNRT